MCEFGGAEYRGDPEGLFRASLEGQVGRQVGAAVEVLFTAGQAQVQALVTEGGIFIALEVGHRRVREDSLRTVRRLGMKECHCTYIMEQIVGVAVNKRPDHNCSRKHFFGSSLSQL